MLLIFLSFLISTAFWLWIILKYDKFEREPIKTVVFVFLLGGLISTFPAALLNDILNTVIFHEWEKRLPIDRIFGKYLVFYGFSGFNEEVFKAFATILLIRRRKNFNEPADALVYSMTVALGFAVYENILYVVNYGYITLFARQFNAVPLHLGLAAIWGTGIAKAKFLYQGKYFRTVAPYILFAALIHTMYNIGTMLTANPFIKLIILSVIAYFLIRYAIRKMRRYAQEGPFANRLFCNACGTVNLPDERSCKKCGQKFELEFYVLCPDCNVKVNKTSPKCPNCGTEMNTEITENQQD